MASSVVASAEASVLSCDLDPAGHQVSLAESVVSTARALETATAEAVDASVAVLLLAEAANEAAMTAAMDETIACRDLRGDYAPGALNAKMPESPAEAIEFLQATVQIASNERFESHSARVFSCCHEIFCSFVDSRGRFKYAPAASIP